MVGFRKYQILILIILLGFGATDVAAAEGAPSLYDQPVLTLDPGMHTAMINRADTDAAGTTVVTGSDDKTIRIWSVRTGELLHTIRVAQGPGNVGKVDAVAISPNGQLVAAGGWTRWTDTDRQEQIYLFDIRTGALVRRIEGLRNVVLHLVFSPDGRYLAATLWGANGLRVYDRESGWSEVARDGDYGDDSYGAAFARDGRLATTSLDRHIRLYDHAFRRVAVTAAGGGTQPFGIAFNPAGDRLAVSYGDSTAVSVFDGRNLDSLSGPDTSAIEKGSFLAVAWSADGATLYAGGTYGAEGSSVVAWPGAGSGTRRELPASADTIMSLRPLPDGGLLVAAANPYLAVLDAAGTPRWAQRPLQMDARGQRSTLGVSSDGSVVDFGYEAGGKVTARFDVARLALSLDPPKDGQTAPPEQMSLKIGNWVNSYSPTLDGTRLPLANHERSRSLAIHPDGGRFVLGADWSLRAFEKKGKPLWQRPVTGAVWAVNISGDGRLVIAAYDDGTIRWHRMEDGSELLALFPLADHRNWVAWTPEGVYAATPGAYGVLRWHVNHGWDAPGEAIPVSEIPETHRPEVIRLVLQQMGTPGAIAVAELTKIRDAIKQRTGTSTAPGARLLVLTVGISDYGEAAKQLRLNFAAADANDVAAALLNTQKSLYAAVLPQRLSNKDATRSSILRGLATMREAMARDAGNDLAVFQFSGHGALIDGEFYLLPYGVDVGDAVSIEATALPASALRQQLDGLAQYGRVLVLLDACHSGGEMANGQALSVDAGRLRAELAGSNITVLTSSSAEQVSREDASSGHGAFTAMLLEALDDADTDKNGMISVSELTAYLTRHVPALTKDAQTPSVEMRFDGDIFVAGP
jgi:WD40 repeat protein